MNLTSSTLPVKYIAPLLLAIITFQTNISQADTTSNEVFKQMGFSEQEKQDVLNGKLIERMPKERSDRELAVTLAFQVNTDSALLRHKFLQGVSIDKPDDIISYQFISSDSDFPILQLTAQEQQAVASLLKAEPGNTLNLSIAEIKAFNALADTKAGAQRNTAVGKQLQVLLKSRYQAYRQQGAAAIALYQRSDNEQYSLGNYFTQSSQAILPALKNLFPEFHKTILDYPKYTPLGLQERFILLKMMIQGKLAFAMEHRLALKENDAELMASRYFYVSHTLNGQQGIGVLLPNDKTSTAILNIRASSDAVAGFGSSSKHFIGRRLLAESLSEFYQAVQKKYDD